MENSTNNQIHVQSSNILLKVFKENDDTKMMTNDVVLSL